MKIIAFGSWSDTSYSTERLKELHPIPGPRISPTAQRRASPHLAPLPSLTPTARLSASFRARLWTISSSFQFLRFRTTQVGNLLWKQPHLPRQPPPASRSSSHILVRADQPLPGRDHSRHLGMTVSDHELRTFLPHYLTSWKVLPGQFCFCIMQVSCI